MHYFHIYEQDICIGQQWGLCPNDACERFCRRNDFPLDAANHFNAVCEPCGYDVPRNWLVTSRS